MKNVDHASIPKGSVRRHRDPTICAQCGADGGNVEFPLIAALPFCGPCGEKLRNPTIPVWLKASLAAMLLLTTVELVRNVRLFQAYFEASAAHRAFDKGDFRSANELMAQAASHVPESRGLAFEDHFYLSARKLFEDTERPNAFEPNHQDDKGALQDNGGPGQ